MALLPRSLPVKYCSNADVQAFVDEEAWRIGPYSQPEFTKTAQQLFAAARARFGDLKCYDLTIYHH